MPKKNTIDQVNQLIDMGKERGFLTYEEVNSVLPSDIVSPDQIDDLMIMFGEMDIEIVEGAQKVRISKTKLQKTSGETAGEAEEELAQAPFEKFKLWLAGTFACAKCGRKTTSMNFGYGSYICPNCYNGETNFYSLDTSYWLNRVVSRISGRKMVSPDILLTTPLTSVQIGVPQETILIN